MTASRIAIWALLGMLPTLALAEEPEAIRAVLVAHDIDYDGIVWERHEDNGVLLVRSSEGPFARTSLGEWQMEGEARCLRWTRAMAWECYGVTFEGEPPARARFEDSFGNVSTGRLLPRGAE